MNSNLLTNAECFVATYNDNLCGFIAVTHFMHPKVGNMKRVHRLVVLPDYQGVGIGIKLMEFIGKLYKEKGYRFGITMSTPALIYGLSRSSNWQATHFGRYKKHTKENMKISGSFNRITASFELK